MATRVIDDSKLNDIAVAIQAKDSGGQMTVDEMAGRIQDIPTGSEFGMSVTDNQVKMIIEVNDNDLSLWTRFGQTTNSTVTVDWGDGTQEAYTASRNVTLEYAPQRKHQYQKAGIYLVTITATNGTFTVGSINVYSTLSEGPLSTTGHNGQDIVRRMYNAKLKEISLGDMVPSRGITNVPYVKIHGDIYYTVQATGFQNNVHIKDGVTSIGAYWFNDTTAYSIKIPSSVNFINNNAFDGCRARIIDFTDMELTEQGELPFSISATNVFRGSSSTILLFKTQEISEVAKNTTNLSVYASRIKYEGEEY